MVNSNTPIELPGLLGDTVSRDYSRKLRLFNVFAARELRAAIASLNVEPGTHVLDAGCGTGEALHWLAEAAAQDGRVVGIDLSAAHIAAARASVAAGIEVMQGDLRDLKLPHASFDLIWCVNTINHLHDPLATLKGLVSLLRPGGRIALGQSSLVPDMYFAWDARLERLTNEAVRRYYRERYRLDERDLAAVRAIVGLLRGGGLQNVTARTFPIERLSPLGPQDQDYLLEAVFRRTWGERLRPYLSREDYEELARLCDPHAPEFALRRPDFHFIQSFTLAVGHKP
jgi:SAM-dependent methyltransferase